MIMIFVVTHDAQTYFYVLIDHLLTLDLQDQKSSFCFMITSSFK